MLEMSLRLRKNSRHLRWRKSFNDHRLLLLESRTMTFDIITYWFPPFHKEYLLPPFQKKYPVDFDDELKIGDVRYDDMTYITIKVQLFWRLPYVTFLKNEPFLSNRRFKKGCFLKKVRFYFFIKLFLHTFCQKRTFCYPTTFFKSLINHKRFVFEESYTSYYSKRQKSCTLIVV